MYHKVKKTKKSRKYGRRLETTLTRKIESCEEKETKLLVKKHKEMESTTMMIHNISLGKDVQTVSTLGL